MKKQGNVLIIFLLTVVVIISSLAAYLYFQNQELKKPLTYEECIKIPGSLADMMLPSTCHAPDGRTAKQVFTAEEQKKVEPSDEMTKWKTYTDSKYQVTFKYPDTYKMLDSVPISFKGTMLDLAGNSCRGPVLQDSQNPKVLVVFEIVPVQSDGGFCWSNGTFTADSKWSPSGDSWKGDYFVMQKAAENSKNIAFAGLANNRTYRLTSKDVFDQILSTFKFTDQTTSVSTTKTYTNQSQGFEISYPSDWNVVESPFNSQQGNVALSNPEASMGVIKIFWGGGFGGGPCPYDHKKVTTNAGIIDMCRQIFNDGSINLSRANDSIGETFKDKSSQALMFTVSIKNPTAEQKVLDVLKTFAWL